MSNFTEDNSHAGNNQGNAGNAHPGNNTPGDQSHASGGNAHSGNNAAGNDHSSSGIQHRQETQQPEPWHPSHDGVVGDMETNVHDAQSKVGEARQAMTSFLNGDANIVDAAMAVKGAYDAVTQLTSNLSSSLMMPVMKALGPFKGQAILPAAKQMDPVMGIDVHMVTIPPSPPGVPIPMPHPYIGMLFHAKDWVSCAINTFKKTLLDKLPEPAEDDKSVMASVAKNKEAIASIAMGLANLGASVKFGDVIPRAITGTACKNIPHIPMGAGFSPAFDAAVAKNDGKAFLGSFFVVADGDPMVGSFHLNYDCWDIGVVDLFKALRGGGKIKNPDPPEPDAPKAELFVPSGTVMPIPSGRPVLVNSIPTPINPLAILDKLFKAGLAKLKRHAVEAIINRVKDTALGKRMGCDFWTAVSAKHGTAESHPVDVSGGYFYTTNEDFKLPGPIPLVWERIWQSFSRYNGPLGYGWHHSYDMALGLDFIQNIALIRLADGRPAIFDIPTLNNPTYNRTEKLTLHLHEEGYYYASDVKNLIYRFTEKEYKNPFSKTEGHLLQSVANRNGFAIRLSYDRNAILTQIIDSAGRVLKVDNNGQGKITSIQAPDPRFNGRGTFSITNYSYTPDGDMSSQADALNQAIYFEYANHLMVKEVWRNGCVWQFRYDKERGSDAKCIEVWGTGGLLHYKFDYSNPQCTIVTNSLGYIKTFYHRNGLVTKYIDPNGAAWEYRYNRNNELELITDPLGNQTAFTHDDWGNVSTIIRPDGLFTQKKYYDSRHPFMTTEETDEKGGLWLLEYNESGRLIKMTNPLKALTTLEYKNGLLEKIINPVGSEISLKYDTYYNLSSIERANGAIAVYHYDGLGNCIEFKNAKGRVEKSRFDLLNRLIEVSELDRNTIRLVYDAMDNIVQFQDDIKNIQYRYNEMSELISRTDAGNTVHYKFDTEIQLRKIINEHGLSYIIEWDGAGRVTSETGFDGLTRTYERNLAGWRTRMNRPGKKFTDYNYDEAGRLIQYSYYDGTKETFKYEKGMLKEAINENAILKFERNILGSITAEYCNGSEIRSNYDSAGKRFHITSNLGADIKLEYDAMGDVIAQHALGWKSEIKRDLFGLEVEKQLPGGLICNSERDSIGRIMTQSVGQQKTKQSFINFKYQRKYIWTVNDMLKEVTDNITGSTRFEYDESSNLAKTTFSDHSEQLRNPDAVGNLFETIDRSDRIYEKGGKLVKSKSATYYYDDEGFLIKKEMHNGDTWGYHWTAGQMLEKVVRPDGTEVFFKYDGLGRRIEKRFKKTITKWAWDVNKPLHEWKEFDAKECSADEMITWVFNEADYTVVSKIKGTKEYSIISDHSGTPIQGYSIDGEIVWSRQLDSYGKARMVKGDEGFCNYLYPGQVLDAETGLAYNRFRYYSPDEGKYISQDPIGVFSGEFGFYNYVHDPNGFIDVFGLAKCLLTEAEKARLKAMYPVDLVPAKAHDHHIVREKAHPSFGPEHERHVRESQAILDKAGIGLNDDIRNFTRATNGDGAHTAAAAAEVHRRLTALPDPSNTQAVADELRAMGDEMNAGTFPK